MRTDEYESEDRIANLGQKRPSIKLAEARSHIENHGPGSALVKNLTKTEQTNERFALSYYLVRRIWDNIVTTRSIVRCALPVRDGNAWRALTAADEILLKKSDPLDKVFEYVESFLKGMVSHVFEEAKSADSPLRQVLARYELIIKESLGKEPKDFLACSIMDGANTIFAFVEIVPDLFYKRYNERISEKDFRGIITSKKFLQLISRIAENTSHDTILLRRQIKKSPGPSRRKNGRRQLDVNSFYLSGPKNELQLEILRDKMTEAEIEVWRSILDDEKKHAENDRVSDLGRRGCVAKYLNVSQGSPQQSGNSTVLLMFIRWIVDVLIILYLPLFGCKTHNEVRERKLAKKSVVV